ncbi:MAG: hypothetical protein KDD63_03865 [Bacteroidetes bacterium]|nr:hypothetical protein [Bacteroidota bacterium]
MGVKTFIKKQLLGIDYPQEYLCLALEENQHFPKVILNIPGQNLSIDVTENHLFLGYKPLIIGLPFKKSQYDITQQLKEQITLDFFHQEIKIAEIQLQYESEIELGENRVLLYTGQKASHQFISHFHQMVHRRTEGRIKKKNDPLQLSGNLYDQVRVAYAYPRFISLVTVGKGNRFNVFPTDLNGPVDSTHFLISLRHNGKANEQVSDIGELLLSRIQASAFQQAYQMGKNHMKLLRAKDEFEFRKELSYHYQLPVPASTIFYQELEKIGDYQIGIHKIHQFKVHLRSEDISGQPTLTHIHAFYAQWRKNQGIITRYLIR